MLEIITLLEELCSFAFPQKLFAYPGVSCRFRNFKGFLGLLFLKQECPPASRMTWLICLQIFKITCVRIHFGFHWTTKLCKFETNWLADI